MIWFLFIIWQGVLGRLSGNGFGSKWGVSWLPELLHSLPYGIAAGWAIAELGGVFIPALFATSFGTAISYAGMQAATWMFLRWKSHKDPNTERKSTLKPIIDWIAGKFGYQLGDEGYAWVAAGVKGFIIGLPVGGFLTAAGWMIGYEIGSHAKGRVEKLGIKDHHAVSEFMASALGGLSIVIFVKIIQMVIYG
jgi:hypothetical protein